MRNALAGAYLWCFSSMTIGLSAGLPHREVVGGGALDLAASLPLEEEAALLVPARHFQ